MKLFSKETFITAEDLQLILIILLAVFLGVYVMTFPNPVSDTVWSFKFPADNSTVNAPHHFFLEVNSKYDRLESKREFAYCLRISNGTVTSYSEANYLEPENRDLAYLGKTTCPNQFNGFLHSQPILCRMSNRDYIFWGSNIQQYKYMAVICDQNKILIQSKDQLRLQDYRTVRRINY